MTSGAHNLEGYRLFVAGLRVRRDSSSEQPSPACVCVHFSLPDSPNRHLHYYRGRQSFVEAIERIERIERVQIVDYVEVIECVESASKVLARMVVCAVRGLCFSKETET